MRGSIDRSPSRALTSRHANDKPGGFSGRAERVSLCIRNSLAAPVSSHFRRWRAYDRQTLSTRLANGLLWLCLALAADFAELLEACSPEVGGLEVSSEHECSL